MAGTGAVQFGAIELMVSYGTGAASAWTREGQACGSSFLPPLGSFQPVAQAHLGLFFVQIGIQASAVRCLRICHMGIPAEG